MRLRVPPQTLQMLMLEQLASLQLQQFLALLSWQYSRTLLPESLDQAGCQICQIFLLFLAAPKKISNTREILTHVTKAESSMLSLIQCMVCMNLLTNIQATKNMPSVFPFELFSYKGYTQDKWLQFMLIIYRYAQCLKLSNTSDVHTMLKS